MDNDKDVILKLFSMLGKNKDIINIILKVLSVVCVMVGAYFLLNSTEMGDDQVSEFIVRWGGSVAPEKILTHFNAYTETYRIFGGVLLAVGLIRLLK